MNSGRVNLQNYCNKFVNLYNYTQINMGYF